MANFHTAMNEILEAVASINHDLKGHYFNLSNSYESKMAVKKAMNFFGLSENETVLMAVYLTYYCSMAKKPVCTAWIAEDYSCTCLKVLQYQEDIQKLEDKGFIRVDTCDVRDTNEKFYRVSEAVYDAVVKNDRNLLKNRFSERDKAMIYPENIKEKDLFYAPSIQKQVEQLYTYFENENFMKIQQRLKEKSLNTGVCVMLYGASGTGKTETVYQMARKTNRPLMYVDISSTVSQWKNGTANNLSQVFSKYENMRNLAEKNNEPCPVLLFNEADALFGKRFQSPQYGGEMEENHIQSVLLDLIERQKGILIITTNLDKSLDSAFERRFLFKVKFDKPDTAIKTKIWKSKLSWLKGDKAEILASSYELNGGQIDNVARKVTMKEILTGKRPAFEEVRKLCTEEKLHSEDENRRIGFLS